MTPEQYAQGYGEWWFDNTDTNESRITIVSLGDSHRTTVLVDGIPMANATSVTWTCEVGEQATCTVTFDGVPVILSATAEIDAA